MMLGGPLRHLAGVRRGVIASPVRLSLISARNQFHTTRRLLKDEENKDDKPTSTPTLTPTPTPTTAKASPTPTSSSTAPPAEPDFWNTILKQTINKQGSTPKPVEASRRKETYQRTEEDEEEEATAREFMEEIVEDVETRKILKAYQKRGDWDKPAVRKVMYTAIKNAEEVQKEEEPEAPVEPGYKNQEYTAGKYKVSIEDVDADVVARHRNAADDIAAATSRTVKERPEQVIKADNNPDLIDAILDRPSQIDSRIAKMEGKEFFHFASEEELTEFEEGKGAPPKKKLTRSEARSIATRNRPPATKKNEFGADQLTLIYDEQQPKDRAIIPFKDPLKKLKYLPIYPAKIKTWVTYMRHCKGRYNKYGYWENDPQLQELEEDKREELKIAARESGDSGISLMEDKKKRDRVPLDLEGHYRFGVQPEELVGIHPKVKELLSFKHANNSEIHAFRKQQLIKRWQERPDDHGTPQVQIAMMTNRIDYLTEHLRTHRRDKVTRLYLRLLISKRQSLLNYIKKKNTPIYFQLVKEMNIKDHS